MRTLLPSLALSALVSLALAGGARADVTIGSIVVDPAAVPFPCDRAQIVAQATSDPATPYTVPVGGGRILSWQTSTLDSTEGADVTLVVLAPSGLGAYRVVAVDSQTLPDPLPADDVASFTLPTPIAVAGGETLGLYTDASDANCYHVGGLIPSASRLTALDAPSLPAPGQLLMPALPLSEGGYALNVATTLRPDHDVAVSTAASPDTATIGGLALLSSSVTNLHGDGANPITFTDTVPAGLTVNAAAAGSGTCATAGQQVTCRIEHLPQGKAVPVNVVVTPTAAGRYANSVSVATNDGVTDPDPANNAASATLTVGAGPPAPNCVVPALKRTPQRVAKRVLKRLGCRIGKSRRIHSRAVGKGKVFRTSPRAGTYPVRTIVRLTLSLGRKKR